jgi:hypothetical protein
MKFALCLSGDPRYYRNTIESIYENIIKINDCDVFGHFWIRTRDNIAYQKMIESKHLNIDFMVDNGVQLLQKIKEIIKFTKLETEDSKDFSTETFISSNVPNDEIKKSIMRQSIAVQSQYYSVWKSNELKKDFEKKNNFIYDGVMRLRPDILIDNPVFFTEFNLNFVHATLWNQNYMYDHMALSNSQNMDIFSDYYFHMKEIFDDDKINNIVAQEVHLPYYLRKYGLVIQNNDFKQEFKYIRNIVR